MGRGKRRLRLVVTGDGYRDQPDREGGSGKDFPTLAVGFAVEREERRFCRIHPWQYTEAPAVCEDARRSVKTFDRSSAVRYMHGHDRDQMNVAFAATIV